MIQRGTVKETICHLSALQAALWHKWWCCRNLKVINLQVTLHRIPAADPALPPILIIPPPVIHSSGLLGGTTLPALDLLTLRQHTPWEVHFVKVYFYLARGDAGEDLRGSISRPHRGDSLRTVRLSECLNFALCCGRSIPLRPIFCRKAWLDVTDTGLILPYSFLGFSPISRANCTLRSGTQSDFQGKPSSSLRQTVGCFVWGVGFVRKVKSNQQNKGALWDMRLRWDRIANVGYSTRHRS